MTGSQANFLSSLGWAVLNSLWQMALLWVIYQAVTAIFKPARPAARGLLATSLLGAGFAWFIYTFILAYAAGNGNATLIAAGFSERSSSGNWLQRVLPIASMAYLILMIIPLLRFIRNYRYVRVIRHYGLSKIDPVWRIFVQKLADRMGINKPVQVWLSEWVTSPVTIGFLKPVILVPLAAVNHLSTAQMEAVLLHELSHIKRYDYLVNLIVNAIRVILYFNPFTRAFARIIETEREKSCDEMVLQFQYDSHEYARALLTLEKISLQQRILVIPATGKQQELMNRVEIIVGAAQQQKTTLRRMAGWVAGFTAIIAINLMLVTQKPVMGKTATLYGKALSSLFINDADNQRGALTEIPQPAVYNSIEPEKDIKENNKKEEAPAAAPAAIAQFTHPGIIAADFKPEIVVHLEPREEKQVKEALEASRKVMENEQWKQVEKSLADAFSQQEKEAMRNAWRKELNKYDWKTWENKLRQAYDHVDWDRVNYQLSDAIKRMQVDSLVRVYTHTAMQLEKVQQELNTDSLEGIPDTDITLKQIAEKQRQVEQAIRNLKATKTKKIVHL